jgi:lipopolysaccharide/colanic/teichoic acid biosynthesis glycosyltransferase
MASSAESLTKASASPDGQRSDPLTRPSRLVLRRRQLHAGATVTDAEVAPLIYREATALDQVVPRPRLEGLSRVLNAIIAVIGCVVLAPAFGLIALLIKATSPGPVLYSQSRVGLDRRRSDEDTAYDRRSHNYGGRLFKMYKFRTMRVDAESDGRAVWAERIDPRVTSIGKVLRRTRLDELPQLYNVIRGDMNIVGPRPERPSIFERLRVDVPLYSQRQRVKPGITGWAQINQGYDASVDDVRRKVLCDLEYLRRQSVLEDLRIMVMTLPVMVLRRGGW